MEANIECLICGNVLEYFPNTTPHHCFYCGSEQVSNVQCASGHFVCDSCHSLKPNDLIMEFCFNTDMTDPIEMATLLMRNPKVNMHGPEHHFLVPAVLLTSYYNTMKELDLKAEKVLEARKRSARVPGGYCGTHGNCGAGVGTGIFMSLILGSTPLAEEEWGLSNRMTAESLMNIAKYGGPRCCKRTTFLSILSAVKFVKENLSVELKIKEMKICEFSEKNLQCINERCPFFPAK